MTTINDELRLLTSDALLQLAQEAAEREVRQREAERVAALAPVELAEEKAKAARLAELDKERDKLLQEAAELRRQFDVCRTNLLAVAGAMNALLVPWRRQQIARANLTRETFPALAYPGFFKRTDFIGERELLEAQP